MGEMTTPTLLVLAAGMGSRYGGLKQIDPVGPSGETIIDYSVYDALRAGFGKIVFVIRHDIEEAFRESVGKRFEKHANVAYAFQELTDLPAGHELPAGRTKPWGTTHAILATTEVIHEPFAVINADDFYGAATYRILAQHLQSGAAEYALAGFILRNTLSDFGSVARGICSVDDRGFLQSVEELTAIQREGSKILNRNPAGPITELTGEELVSMNMWAFTPAIFPQLKAIFDQFLVKSGHDLKAECYLPTSVSQLVTEGKASVRMLSTPESWFGVTYKQDHAHVVESISRLIQSGAYPESLWS